MIDQLVTDMSQVPRTTYLILAGVVLVALALVLVARSRGQLN